MRVAGVDGCYGGWLVAQADVTPDGLVGAPIVSVVRTFGDVLALGLGRIVVDIPIGLPDTWVSGQGRACDRAARALLAGPRASSVFAAPPRAALELVDWDDPRRPATGMSRQAFAILSKIREVDAVTRPEMQDATAWIGPVVLESHPEVIFRDLNGGRAVPDRKRTAVGAARRRALLGAAFGPNLVIPPAPPGSRTDDVLDGLACLWVAAAPVDHLDPLGGSDDPPRDARGLQMAIWRRRPMSTGLDTSPEVAPTAAAPPSWLGPAGYAWSRLAPLALGRYAEYLVKMAFTMYGLDVYGSEVDDKGIDFVIRAGPSRYFDVQVKSLRGWGGYTFMKKATFPTDPSRLVALVHCLDGEPPVLYLIRGSAWLTSTSLLVARDYGDGRKSAPEYGISLARRNAEELDRYRFETVVAAL